jgi:hypothetical protein
MPQSEDRGFALGQAYRRFLNDIVDQTAQRGHARPLGRAEPFLIWCECGRPDCGAVVSVLHGEYEAARLHAARFLVAPGHLVPEVDRPVFSSSRVDLVEVRPGAADVVVPLSAPLEPRGGPPNRRAIPPFG